MSNHLHHLRSAHRGALTHVTIALLVAFVWAAAADARAQASGYREPDFSEPLFAREALLLETHEVTAAVDALAAVAANFGADDGVDADLQAKALAVGLRLDGSHVVARATNRALRAGEQPSVVGGFSTKAGAARQLWETAGYLESPEMNRDERVLQFLLAEIARALDPSNLAESNRYPATLPDNLFGGWEGILTGGASPGFEFPPASPTGDGGNGGDGTTSDPTANPPPVVARRPAEGSFRALSLGAGGSVVPILGTLTFPTGNAPRAVTFSDPDGNTDHPLNRSRDSLVRALTTLHGGSWPRDGGVLVLTPSSAAGRSDRGLTLPAAILADSLIRGHQLDENAAAAGAVAPDGMLVAARQLRYRLGDVGAGDAAAALRLVVVPRANLVDLYDLALLGDLDPLFDYQLMVAEDLQQAVAMAAAPAERSDGFQQSLEDFELIREVARDDDATEVTGYQTVQDALTRLLEHNPQHASAQVLLLHGTGGLPPTLSLHGSLAALSDATRTVVDTMRAADGGGDESETVLRDPATARVTLASVERLAPLLHPEAAGAGAQMRAVLADIADYAGRDEESLAEAEAVELRARIKAGWDDVRAEFKRLGDLAQG